MIALAIIAAVIFFICMIPIGADIGYENNELSLSAKFCGVFLQLLPKDTDKPKKEKKAKKPKKEKIENPGEEKPKKKLKLDFTFDEIVELVKKVFKGLGKLTRFKVDRFLLHYVAANGDPYKMTVTYGKINAFLDALAPVCRQRFDCPDVDVYTGIDFTAEKQIIDFGLGFSIRIGQIFGAINTIIFGALGILIKNFLRHFWEKIKLKFSKRDNLDEENVAVENAVN